MIIGENLKVLLVINNINKNKHKNRRFMKDYNYWIIFYSDIKIRICYHIFINNFLNFYNNSFFVFLIFFELGI